MRLKITLQLQWNDRGPHGPTIMMVTTDIEGFDYVEVMDTLLKSKNVRAQSIGRLLQRNQEEMKERLFGALMQNAKASRQQKWD